MLPLRVADHMLCVEHLTGCHNHRSSPIVQILATLDRYSPGVQHSTNGFSSSARLPLNGTIDGFEQERALLQAEIAAAKQRIIAARHRAESRDAAARAALRAEIASTREILAEMEGRHREAAEELERFKGEAVQLAPVNAAEAVSTERSTPSNVE